MVCSCVGLGVGLGLEMGTGWNFRKVENHRVGGVVLKNGIVF